MTTLTTIRARCAREIGTFYTSTATANSTTAILEDSAWGAKSSIAQDDFYADYFLFRPSAAAAGDKVRLVKSYSAASGQFTPDLAWTNAPYSGTGETYELHALIEPHTALKRLINQALLRCMLVVEFTVTPVLLQTRHSLTTAASWLTRPEWVHQVGYLGSTEDRDEIDPFGRTITGQAYLDGTTVYIQHRGRTFNPSAETIYVRASKPAYYHCKASAGSYGGQSGLSLETDETPIGEDWAAAATLVEAWRDYAHLLEPAANQKIIRDRAEAAAWFSKLTEDNYTEPRQTHRPIYHWGPRR